MDLSPIAPANTLINNLKIAIPTVVVIIIIIYLCKCFFRCRRTRGNQAQQAQASARVLEPPPAVYTIPVSPTQEQQHGPPQYNLPQQYPPPPAYNELMPKPDFPSAPPPAYTEVISSRISPSAPDQITPSCPPLPQ